MAAVLVLPQWNAEQWHKLLAHTEPRSFRTSEVVIQRNSADRTLYLVAAGSLEVGVTQVDGISMTSLARIGAGSILGEQSFFDGQPRSANVWAVADGTLLLLPFDVFTRFSEAEPVLARETRSGRRDHRRGHHLRNQPGAQFAVAPLFADQGLQRPGLWYGRVRFGFIGQNG